MSSSAEMLTAVHSDNTSGYRPLLKQLLLAQPEHRALERLGRSSPAIAQLAHRFLAREEHALARHRYRFHRNASRAAGQVVRFRPWPPYPAKCANIFCPHEPTFRPGGARRGLPFLRDAGACAFILVSPASDRGLSWAHARQVRGVRNVRMRFACLRRLSRVVRPCSWSDRAG